MKKIPETQSQWNETFLLTLFLGTILLPRGYCNICSTAAKGISNTLLWPHLTFLHSLCEMKIIGESGSASIRTRNSLKEREKIKFWHINYIFCGIVDITYFYIKIFRNKKVCLSDLFLYLSTDPSVDVDKWTIFSSRISSFLKRDLKKQNKAKQSKTKQNKKVFFFQHSLFPIKIDLCRMLIGLNNLEHGMNMAWSCKCFLKLWPGTRSELLTCYGIAAVNGVGTLWV